MTKQEKWSCVKGCDLSKRPCAHLERLLSPMWEQEVRVVDISKTSMDVFQAYRPTFNLSEFQQTMRDFGFFQEWDMELLTARYFYDQTLRQIADEYAYCSFKTVHRRLKVLHGLLKERGFKPRSVK